MSVPEYATTVVVLLALLIGTYCSADHLRRLRRQSMDWTENARQLIAMEDAALARRCSEENARWLEDPTHYLMEVTGLDAAKVLFGYVQREKVSLVKAPPPRPRHTTARSLPNTEIVLQFTRPEDLVSQIVAMSRVPSPTGGQLARIVREVEDGSIDL
ncbi:hypothetical protein SEA_REDWATTLEHOG_144 [Gordonia phage RedWattleHog]|nr:hypothetical protein SEA_REDWATTLEHOG_144 [Gordonia phage RedWattleHog]